MNKIILIGNGFDLAHNLKTSYNDFILWYLNKSYDRCNTKNILDDKLLQFNTENNIPWIKDTSWELEKINFTSIKDFNHYIDSHHKSVTYKHAFIKNIITHSSNYNWVDIESLYFKALLTAVDDYNKYHRLDAIKALNTSFDFLKQKLEEYLTTIDYTNFTINEEINQHFVSLIQEIKRLKESSGYYNDKIMILNFNYTPTVKKYFEGYNESTVTLNYIHGELKSESNPIIFGYGDEKHAEYANIEQLDEDDFLMNVKSFHYMQTKNYRDFTNFVESNDFEVYIMGHSCGLSDRILLSSIFENEKCRKIKILFHQKSDKEDDFFEKTQKISRHFRSDLKHDMRLKIVPKEVSKPLVPYNK